MKTYLILIIFLAALMPLCVSAQDAKEDVIYMKDGSVYRGTIIEQIPGVSYKIEIAGGSVIAIKAEDVTKITKEPKAATDTRYAYPEPFVIESKPGKYSDLSGGYRPGRHMSVRGYKDMGGFFQVQFSGQYAGGGVRVMGGYKINQFAIIGIGIGLDGVYTGANIHSLGGDPSPYSAVYFPFFIHYSGDILKKDITPFYELNIGYSFAANGPATNDDPSYYGGVVNTTTGGPMGSMGFGIRIYAGRRFVFTMSADLDIQYARTEVDNYGAGYGSYNNSPPTFIYSRTTLLLPGLRIGLGLVK